MSPVRLYWQTRAPISGRVRERGEAAGRVLPRDLLVGGEREPVERVRIDVLSRPVGRDLHPEPAELAVAVGGRVVVAEAGCAGPGAVDAEEEDVAA